VALLLVAASFTHLYRPFRGKLSPLTPTDGYATNRPTVQGYFFAPLPRPKKCPGNYLRHLPKLNVCGPGR